MQLKIRICTNAFYAISTSQRLLVIPFAKSIYIKKKYKKVLIHRQDAKQIDFPWFYKI